MKGAKNIYTLHDLVPLRLPYTTLDNKSYYLRLMKKIVHEADHIITVSETSRLDIIKLLDCPESKVTNTYQSVEIPQVLTNKSVEQVQAEIYGALGLDYKKYVLFYGAIEPKKNVGRIIEAYLSSGIDIPLVLIGTEAWKADEELKLFKSKSSVDKKFGVQLSGRILHFDYVPFSLLVSAIRGAKATIFPSLYEGFGLPILESMLLGTPVVTSKEGATAEIAGDAALLVDPYRPNEISSALVKIITDDELNTAFSHRGLHRSEVFSREAHAKRINSVHGKLGCFAV